MVTLSDWFVHMRPARWFQAKSLAAGLSAIEPRPWLVQEPTGWARSELAVVEHAAGRELYHLPVAYLPRGTAAPEAVVGRAEVPGLGTAEVVDAPLSPQAMALFLRGLTAGGPGLTWKAAPPDPGAETKLFTGEQSNTNLQIGPDHLLKIYRKLVAGPGLDGEVLGALSGSGVTPALIGLWRADDLDLDLGLCCQRIKDGQDGWDWARAASRASRPVGPQLAQLGQALRRLHQLLAQAFPTDRLDAAEVGRRIRWRFDLAAAELPEVAALRLGLERVLGRLDPEAVPVQRLHGDFHLGQALISPDGWTIIDFEGEPLKTPAERRGLDSPWRDVAGLLRSIDYARRSHSEPDSTVAVAWAADARRGFLEGYLGPAGAPPPLLAAYEADKAVYELVYETRNRPGWADLPRRALAGLLG